MTQPQTPAPVSAPDRIGQAILIIIASVLAMAFGDALVKQVSTDLSVWQVFALRSAFALPLLLVLIGVRPKRQGRQFAVIAPGWVMLRSLLLVLTWLAYYAALPVLSLPVAAVAVYTNPVITTLMAALLVGDRVHPRQWLGVGLSFAGMVIILRPGGDAFNWAILLPLLAAFLYSAAMILTRVKCRDESPLVLGLSVHAGFLLTGLIALGILAILPISGDVALRAPFLLNGWTSMSGSGWLLLAGLGLLSAGYFIGVARAYQIAPPSVVATFDYAYLPAAAFWAFLLFADTPDIATWAGMALITTAGLLVLRRTDP